MSDETRRRRGAAKKTRNEEEDALATRSVGSVESARAVHFVYEVPATSCDHIGVCAQPRRRRGKRREEKTCDRARNGPQPRRAHAQSPTRCVHRRAPSCSRRSPRSQGCGRGPRPRRDPRCSRRARASRRPRVGRARRSSPSPRPDSATARASAPPAPRRASRPSRSARSRPRGPPCCRAPPAAAGPTDGSRRRGSGTSSSTTTRPTKVRETAETPPAADRRGPSPLLHPPTHIHPH